MDKAKQIFLQQLGERIAFLREQAGLNQTQLGDQCEKDRQSINRLEKGNVNPSIYYLHQVATALNVSLSELVKMDEKTKK